ncbi:MAG: hypothetical protein U0Q19_14435 [Kineosporiaceae bacterium]
MHPDSRYDGGPIYVEKGTTLVGGRVENGGAATVSQALREHVEISPLRIVEHGKDIVLTAGDPRAVFVKP